MWWDCVRKETVLHGMTTTKELLLDEIEFWAWEKCNMIWLDVNRLAPGGFSLGGMTRIDSESCFGLFPLVVAYVYLRNVAQDFGSQDLNQTSMDLFNRKKGQGSDSADSSDKKEKGSWKRPASLWLSLSLLFNIWYSLQILRSNSRGLKHGNQYLRPKQFYQHSSSLELSLHPLVAYSYGDRPSFPRYHLTTPIARISHRRPQMILSRSRTFHQTSSHIDCGLQIRRDLRQILRATPS